MTDRYSWKDVQGGALPRYERAVRAFLPEIPHDRHMTVEGGSVTNGITATVHWRNGHGHVIDLPIPGGQHLARSAKESFNLLADRARVLEDITYWKERQ